MVDQLKGNALFRNRSSENANMLISALSIIASHNEHCGSQHCLQLVLCVLYNIISRKCNFFQNMSRDKIR